MRSPKSFLIALGTALSASFFIPVAAAEEPETGLEAELETNDVEDVELVSAGTLDSDTERSPAVVVGVKTVRPGHDPQMIGVFLFSRRPTLTAHEPRALSPLRIAPARLNGIWVLVAEGRF